MTRRFQAPWLPEPGEETALDTDTSHHVLRVNLIPRGTRVVLFDGDGRECDGELVDARGGQAIVRALSAARAVPTPPACVLVAGLTRKPAWERVLRMATELGVVEIRPFEARRSIAKGDHPDRWERIVADAARQCGRARLPRIHAVSPLSEALEQGEGVERLVLLPGAEGRGRPTRDVALLVGPEGGLAPDEVEQALDAGYAPAGLGPWTLRADTAAVAALACYTPWSVTPG